MGQEEDKEAVLGEGDWSVGTPASLWWSCVKPLNV